MNHSVQRGWQPFLRYRYLINLLPRQTHLHHLNRSSLLIAPIAPILTQLAYEGLVDNFIG
jgi:hypothetical protein